MGLTILVLADRSDTRAEPPSLTFDAPRLVIGRGDGCEVRLPDPSISSRHASLRQHGGTYLLVDEGSTNGTFIGDVRLSPHAPRVIQSGERIRVGRVWLELRLTAVAVASSPQDTRELALALVQQALDTSGAPAPPRVVVAAGPDEGKELLLARSGHPLCLGRGHGVDLLLDEPDASRRHVQITRKADQVWVRDLGSKNGTFLAEQRLPPERDTLWRAHDELRIGQDRFRHEHPALEALSELERCADEVMASEPTMQAPADASLPDEPSPAAPDVSPAPSPSPAVVPVPSPGAPVVAAPRALRPSAAKAGAGWGPSDVLILLIAVGVIVLSLGGLWFVFR